MSINETAKYDTAKINHGRKFGAGVKRSDMVEKAKKFITETKKKEKEKEKRNRMLEMAQ